MYAGMIARHIHRNFHLKDSARDTKMLEQVKQKTRLEQQEMTLRYAIQTLNDCDKEFTLENLQRELDKNIYAQEHTGR